MRFSLLILFTLSFCKVAGQDSLLVMLTNRIKSDKNFKIKKANNLSFNECDTITFNYVSVRVYKIAKNSKDSLDFHFVKYHQWKDSILIVFKIPADYAKSKLCYKFTYNMVCKEKMRGQKTNFSVYNDDEDNDNITFTFKSKPAGARIYLVPKFFWDKNIASKKKQFSISDIEDFIIPKDLTPVTVLVEEYVYYAIYELGGVIKKIRIAPKRKNKIDSAFIDFKE